MILIKIWVKIVGYNRDIVWPDSLWLDYFL